MHEAIYYSEMILFCVGEQTVVKFKSGTNPEAIGVHTITNEHTFNNISLLSLRNSAAFVLKLK